MPKLAPLLAPRFTVFVYDRRGRGDSGDTAPYAREREIEDLDALVKEAGGEAYVLGLSSGAALALEAAASGVPMKGLVAYEPPYLVDAGAANVDANHEQKLRQLLGEGRRGDAVAYFMRDMVGVPGPVVVMMRLMFWVWPKLTAVAHTLPYDAAVMGDFTMPAARLATIRTPTMVLHGGKTDAKLQRAARDAADAIPGAKHDVLAGQTHNVKPEVLAPAAIAFFKV
jgi:pimeloyl-ACP methyl ester carboxylesterase